MATNTVFKRYELKYMLTKEQCKTLYRLLDSYMQLDEYGRNLIKNTYFDTPNFRLIRRSIEKPLYKEKLRMRSYGEDADTVFIEMKKKFKGVVYKRRLKINRYEAEDFIEYGKLPTENTQIAREIGYFLRHYENLQPAVILNYEREAFFSEDYPELRLTFDYNITVKNLMSDDDEVYKILSDDVVLMELKTHLGIPEWLLRFFRENKIYKTSFSKYGTAYKKFILEDVNGGIKHVV